MQKHSVVISEHETSFSLEPAFWEELKILARKQEQSLTALITKIDRARTGNLSSAIRLYVLEQLKQEVIQNETTQGNPIDSKHGK
ncbi:MAG: ribbon-helix-helix domain-containing protein [Alphaproteobacteria bacterium]|nr:ribbon-helix-helix domain-containing protein [Alphaproteobacteria bacterium]